MKILSTTLILCVLVYISSYIILRYSYRHRVINVSASKEAGELVSTSGIDPWLVLKGDVFDRFPQKTLNILDWIFFPLGVIDQSAFESKIIFSERPPNVSELDILSSDNL